MKPRRLLILALACLLLAMAGYGVRSYILRREAAQSRELYKQAQEATHLGDSVMAAKYLWTAIDQDPANVDAHADLIFTLPGARLWEAQVAAKKRGENYDWNVLQRGTSESARKELRAYYEGLVHRHPKNAIYQWVLGRVSDKPEAEKYYRRAIELNPKFACPYLEFAGLAAERKDLQGRQEWARKAVEADPNDPQSAYYYATVFRTTDPAAYKRLSLDVVNRFPKTDWAARALADLACASENVEEKLVLYERLRTQFLPAQKYAVWDTLLKLYETYAENNPPGRALALAQEMVQMYPKGSSHPLWNNILAYQQNLVRLHNLLAEGKEAEAIAQLKEMRPPGSMESSPARLIGAQLLIQNPEPSRAYRSIVTLVAAEPNEQLLDALQRYGSALGKTPAQVDAEVWALRDTTSVATPVFTLEAYGQSRPVALSALRGRVVLIHFWYKG
jgi:hypothetical protein